MRSATFKLYERTYNVQKNIESFWSCIANWKKNWSLPTEAKFMSIVIAIQKALCSKRFECEILFQTDKSLLLFCDNQGPTSAWPKHIDVKWFIRQKLAKELIELKFRGTNVASEKLITNILIEATPLLQISNSFLSGMPFRRWGSSENV